MVINTKELLNVLRCHNLTLSDWRADGAPFIKGRPCRYDVAKFCAWLKKTHKFGYAAKLEAAFGAQSDDVPDSQSGHSDAETVKTIKKSVSAAAADPDSLLATISNSTFSLFDNRDLIAGMIQKECAGWSRAPALERAASIQSLKQLVEVFRRIETDCIEHAQMLRTIVSVDKMLAYIGASFAIVRNQVRNIPYVASQEIAEQIGGDPGVICDILRPMIDDALSAAAAKITDEEIRHEIDRQSGK